MSESLAFLYGGWRTCNTRLADRLRDLSPAELQLASSPSAWPIWALAGHTAGARVYWLCGVLREAGAETTPFPDPLSGVGWEDDPASPRRADELVTALETSWLIVERCLRTWQPDMLGAEVTRVVAGGTQRHTRQSVLMRLITHDAFHAGEVSSILGAHGLPEIDLWRPA
ncbi:MAG TPA: DinB family protein [Candidatus Limnocylindria bacterium]|nr:DinB family protein [Candidatus Limnocylindria bacterium]